MKNSKIWTKKITSPKNLTQTKNPKIWTRTIALQNNSHSQEKLRNLDKNNRFPKKSPSYEKSRQKQLL